jgi:hypothetical protein
MPPLVIVAVLSLVFGWFTARKTRQSVWWEALMWVPWVFIAMCLVVLFDWALKAWVT